MKCPHCGTDFVRPGMHWYHGTCPYPDIEAWRREMIIGALLGDGSIPNREANHIFHLPMINRRFLEWFDDAMGILTTGVSLKKTATELAENNRKTGFSPNANQENYHDMYTVRSRTHPIFNELREWYASGRKRFPNDLELTPIITKLWYVCDGYLDVGRWGRPRIEIKARNELDNSEYLVSLFEAVGIEPIYKRHELRFTCGDTERLIRWMGSAPPGFEYKWAIGSSERYHDLKEIAYTEYATQTLEA